MLSAVLTLPEMLAAIATLGELVTAVFAVFGVADEDRHDGRCCRGGCAHVLFELKLKNGSTELAQFGRFIFKSLILNVFIMGRLVGIEPTTS